MPKFDVAHLHEQGQDMVIVPVDPSFGYKSEADQAAFENEIQHRARAAGLRGSVVTVWGSGGQMYFRAPRPWHPFFRSISLGTVYANVNKSLSW